MSRAADCSAPRLSRRPDRKSVYWWCDEVKNLRLDSIASRRKWRRAVRKATRGGTIERSEVERRREIYKGTKKRLRVAIVAAKSRAWSELLGLIDEDPWGLPYRLVLGRLRVVPSALTETLEPQLVRSLIDDLFPRDTEVDPRTLWPDPVWDEQCTVGGGASRD